MAAPTLKSSGTQAATLDTEHTLATITAGGVYQLFVDTAAMVKGDKLILRIYYKCLSGGTERLLFPPARYAHVQTDPMKFSVPIASDISVKFTLEQTDGTGRSFPWKVLEFA